MSGRAMGWLLGGLALLPWQPVWAQTQTVVEYIHTDAQGSVVAVTDQSRSVVERREYEPYGLQLSPAVQDGPGYTGHVQDAVTGLTYMQQRYYEPSLGVFLSVDPIGANANAGSGFNRYRYAASNPYRFKDPDGRQEKRIHDDGFSGSRVAIAQINPSPSPSPGGTVRGYGDLPPLREKTVSPDGRRTVGEGWEPTERYTGNQKIIWNPISEAQWQKAPTSLITMPFRKTIVGRLVIPDFRTAIQTGHVGLEYQIGYRHVMLVTEDMVSTKVGDIQTGYDTIWTEERYWKRDMSERGTIDKRVYDYEF